MQEMKMAVENKDDLNRARLDLLPKQWREKHGLSSKQLESIG